MRGSLAALPRGVVPFPPGCWPWKSHDITHDTYDVIQRYGGFGRQLCAKVACVACS
jgi:hypothetical protein